MISVFPIVIPNAKWLGGQKLPMVCKQHEKAIKRAAWRREETLNQQQNTKGFDRKVLELAQA